MTRYEKISQMSLEEMAEYLCDQNEDCNGCPAYDVCEWTYPEVVHANGLKKWLKENTDDEWSKNRSRCTNISDLNFSVRTYNTLKRAGITTLGDILDRERDQLIIIRNMGKRSLDEIDKKMQELGVEGWK